MTKTALIAALLAVLATEASAQSRVFYDVAGRHIGSATTDRGTVTNYDSRRGRVISREITTGNTTTIYDSRGRSIGRSSANR
jgi:YD repeat-containing protein